MCTFPPSVVELQRLEAILNICIEIVYLLYFPDSEEERRSSDYASAQAGLHLCCIGLSRDYDQL